MEKELCIVRDVYMLVYNFLKYTQAYIDLIMDFKQSALNADV